uniref:Polyprotein n=1 Tax=Drosophila melanogaster TaxID=7227 RepID=O76925_DROME|nr:polyprotein [Drosophila melanogaster]
MPIGDDKKKLSADKPRSIFSPQGPKSPRIPSISVKTPAQISDDCATPSKATVQRTAKNMAASDLALAKFISVSDAQANLRLRSTLRNPQLQPSRCLASVATKSEAYGTRLKRIRPLLRVPCVSRRAAASGMPILRASYSYCYSVYERCVAQLVDKIEQGHFSVHPKRTLRPRPTFPLAVGCLHAIQEFSQVTIFAGRFPDLLHAIYINNPRLTPFEKLFHLNAKTSGDAHAIVSISPLTKRGFSSAWENLIERFENKRLLVNSQLKILFNVQSIPQESGAALKVMQSTVQGCLTALELSGINTENWDCLLEYLCSSKLPKITLSLWEQSLHKKADIPTWGELNTFLTERHRTLEAIDDVRPSVPSQSHSKAMNSSGPSRDGKLASDLCNKENHPVRVCRVFSKWSVDDRSAYIKRKQLCLNYFAKGHQLRECKDRQSFTWWPASHVVAPKQPLFQQFKPFKSCKPNFRYSGQFRSKRASRCSKLFCHGSRAILLGSAIINSSHLGTNFKARALIDSGSEATFITEPLFNLIRLPFQVVQAQVSGLNQTVAAQFKNAAVSPSDLRLGRVAVGDDGLCPPSTSRKSAFLPNSAKFLRDLPDFPLADPKFYESAPIDVLIRSPHPASVLLSGAKTNICGSLLGQETIFRWVLTGPVSASAQSRIPLFRHRSPTRTIIHWTNSSQNLGRWRIYQQSCKRIRFHVRERVGKCLRRHQCGKYVVTLPFRDPEHIGCGLGHSRSWALAQFLKNEQRLKKDEALKARYDSVIQEYLDLKHMRQVLPTHDCNAYYMPHHAVLKPESVTTKLRVVFNASSPSSNGTSLNDILHAGPVLQSDLTVQILKWRDFRYVFSADIQKMYRQIWVDPKHTPFQRILFRNNRGEIRDFELKTVTFGVNCAPLLAIRVLQQLAADEELSHPKASNVIRNFMYVDDVLAGADSTEEAQLMVHELRDALNSSSSRQRWLSKRPLQRQVLSQIAKLFDPAGWLAPFIVRAKIFMQEIWLQELGWDENVPNDLFQRWLNFLQSYSVFEQIRIPRWLSFHPDFKVEHHGFCDASQKAYGAAIYVRGEVGSAIMVQLLTAKTRVAPVKTVSLPRLELCGALLLSEMAAAIIPQMPTINSKLYCWTDSTIVLAWLSKPACQWTTFVANRETKIAQATKTENWSHVQSEHNPADLASRGVSLQDLADSQLWWHGPTWLQNPRNQWPTQVNAPVTDLEKRALKVHLAKAPSEELLARFSKLEKALRVLAYVYRFIQRCRKQTSPSDVHLLATEIAAAERFLISNTQRREFPVEYHCLSEKRPVPSSSAILSMNPFLDPQGLIRACGRVAASESPQYNERHPVILPYNCLLSRLLAKFTHRTTLHGGNQLMVRLIRSKYWIPRIKNLMKAVVNSCKVCVIHKRRLQSQLMGVLPKERASFSRPFTVSAWITPVRDIKNYTGRACVITKGYVLVFVCFSTKAIHLEPTSDLTTEKFLAAFSRFVSRRGCPRQVQSDNGKTFVGAATLLSRDFLQAVKESVTNAYIHQEMQWQLFSGGTQYGRPLGSRRKKLQDAILQMHGHTKIHVRRTLHALGKNRSVP